MSTERQIEANRRNAARSTGPRSVEGKAASRMNALKSGIDAEATIIIGEDAGALAELTESFYRDYQPATAMEAALLDNIIRDTWLLTRFFRIDAEIVDYEIEEALYKKEVNQAGRAFMDSSNHQIRLQRRIDQTRKSQIQGFKEFQRLQAERRTQTLVPQVLLLDATAAPSTAKEQIGFVPQNPPEAPEIGPLPIPPAAKTRLPGLPTRSPIGFVA
jgi:hypothetical protein